MYKQTVVLCALLSCALADERPSRLVHTAQGPVRGYKDLDYDVYAYYGIPYATAPTGRDRFKAAGPPPVWQETYEAAPKHIVCSQPNSFLSILNNLTNIQDDCLIANIFVPDTVDEVGPVVVYVHGGAYALGHGNMLDPRAMVSSKKFLAVTFNYRLAAHGFLCLGTEDIPGNAGMKDQVALLRWVKRNIASFGGNPSDVTIAGGSAGSSAVDLLMISKLTKGLFNKVIPESGASTAAFSVQIDPIGYAKEYAKLLGHSGTDNIYDLESFFQSLPLKRLNSVNPLNRTDASFLMSPCVERDTGNEIFLHDNPVNILQSGDYPKVPMLYGFTNIEGLIRTKIAGDVKSDIKRMNKQFSDYLPADLYFTSIEEKEQVANEIKAFFFGKSIDEEDILDYINYFSDVYFVYSTLRSVRLQVEAGNNQIYLYEYSFADKNTPYIPYTKVRGASHCDQSLAIWNFYVLMNPSNTEDFSEVRKILRDMWSNFIYTGKPVPADSYLPEWPPVSKKWSPHMSIGRALELRGSLLKERTEFWDKIYSKHYWSPQPPSSPPPKRSEL